ncbi:MAG: hypothetical protein L0H63_08615 [Nitrococcus sp.]|nr:hypothetical protein [Nitrococcus sp.]
MDIQTENHRHFEAWLRLARRLDWSFEHRDATCVRAFTALQHAMQKCTVAVRCDLPREYASELERSQWVQENQV